LIRGITVFGPTLYWAEAGMGRGIFKMPKEGSPADVLPLNRENAKDAYDVAVDATSIYWADGASFLVSQIPITGGLGTAPTTVFAHNMTVPRYITVDDGGTVYVASESGSILSGRMNSSLHPYSGLMMLAGIAYSADVDAGTRKLLFGYSSGIKEGLTQGMTDPPDIYTGLSGQPVQGVATDGTRVYWISNNSSVRKGEPWRGSAGAWCVTGQDLGPNADIAVDDQWVYFTWPKKNQIYKCLK
jgi:hypothetical protein